jgi:hypothetical protein
MTQRNVEIMDIIVSQLAQGKKLSAALNGVYEKRKVMLPYREEWLAVEISEVPMSNRTKNALYRSHLKTLQDIVNYCSSEGITNAKTMGRRCGIEVFEAVLDYCWDKMDNDQRTYFLIDVVERNENKVRKEIAI